MKQSWTNRLKMSKLLLYPNYCSCTGKRRDWRSIRSNSSSTSVHQARNLPEKGKHGGKTKRTDRIRDVDCPAFRCRCFLHDFNGKRKIYDSCAGENTFTRLARTMRYVRRKTRSAAEPIGFVRRPVVDDATIKLTVYHNTKNALSKGDFIGRAYVSIRDLQDYDRVHRK